MSEKIIQKASFEDLIARKTQKEADKHKTEDIYIPSLDRSLTFHKPNQKEVYQLIDEMDETTFEGVIAGTSKVIYHCCEQLQDTKLHKELGITDPYDVVESLLEVADIRIIGDKLTIFLGIERKKEEIKNS